MKTILVIDDDELCRAPAAEMLRRADWQVIEAVDGESGVKMAVQHRPDVILCDLMMPRGNGFHVCRAVREHLELRHTKIIVVTGRGDDEAYTRCHKIGVDGFLTKPLKKEQLIKAVGETLVAHSGIGRSTGKPGTD